VRNAGAGPAAAAVGAASSALRPEVFTLPVARQAPADAGALPHPDQQGEAGATDALVADPLGQTL
jgi:hypothetical protein